MKKEYLKRVVAFFLATTILISSLIPTASRADDKADLERQLKEIESQIAQYEKELSTTQSQSKTLTSKINSLKKTQADLKLQIKKTGLLIDDLDDQIIGTEKDISDARKQIDHIKKDLTSLLQLIKQKDDTSLVEILASSNSLSEFYDQIHTNTIFVNTLQNLVEKIKSTQKVLSVKQDQLSGQRDDAKNLLSVKTLQQQDLLDSISEQSDILKATKGKESEYNKILTDTKKRAAEIRNRIYVLTGGGQKINFGQAVELASWVSSQTGINTAFLLAILTQESNLGSNVGTCNRAGDPPEKSWKVIMKPERDQELFKTIIANLGKDIDTTPVSCPMKDKNGKQIGWGGAMGPAQFIPSTWMGYEKKIKAITGSSVANPWDNRDAFLASAIKLRADGANGTDSGDWKAAMIYFSGSTNTQFRFYGDNVIKIKNKYLADIADLNK